MPVKILFFTGISFLFSFFHNKNWERWVVFSVQKVAFHDGIVSGIQFGQEREDSVPFRISVIPPVIKAKCQKSAGFQDVKGLLNSGDAGFRTGKNVVISAGEPAEIKDDGVGAFRFGDGIHVAVAHAKDFGTVGKAVLKKILLRAQNGVRLDVHGDNFSAFTDKLAKENGVVTVSGGGINTKISRFYMETKHFMNDIQSAPIAEHEKTSCKFFFSYLNMKADFLSRKSENLSEL